MPHPLHSQVARRLWLQHSVGALAGLYVSLAYANSAPNVGTNPANPTSPANSDTSHYPRKPVRIVVPFNAGGGTDVLARIIGEKLSVRLGQPVVIDNRPGAAGILGTDAVAKATPDGYTLLITLNGSLLNNQFLYDKLPYNPQRDFALVSQIASGPIVLVVHPSVGADNGPQLLHYIANHKNTLSYGSWGVGSYPHLAGTYINHQLQSNMIHVAYKGEGPMLQDLIGGQIQIAFASAMAAKAHTETGKLKTIGVTGTKRLATLPKLPTLAEQGLTDEIYTVVGWLGMAAPAGTPTGVVHRLAAEVKSICDLPDVAERMSKLGFVGSAGTPEEFAANYKNDAPVWEHLVKLSGVRLE